VTEGLDSGTSARSGTEARTGMAAPAPAELGRAVAHAEAGRAAATATAHGTGQVHGVAVGTTREVGDDFRMLQVSRDTLERREAEFAGREVAAAVIDRTVPVLATVLDANPDRMPRIAALGVPRLERVVVAVEFDVAKGAELGKRQTRLHEHEVREVGIVGPERLGNLGDRREIRGEVRETELAADAKIKVALGLGDPRVARLAGHSAGLEAQDQLLQLTAESRFAAPQARLLDVEKIRNLVGRDLRVLHSLTSILGTHLAVATPTQMSPEG
jgi:hypothetical protein